MSLSYINQTYGLSVEKGQSIVFDGQRAVVIGARGQYVKVRFENGTTGNCHPTWRMEYPTAPTKD